MQVLGGFQKIDDRTPGADRTQISCGGAWLYGDNGKENGSYYLGLRV